MPNEPLSTIITNITFVLSVRSFHEFVCTHRMSEKVYLFNAIALHETGQLWSDTTIKDLFFVIFGFLRFFRLEWPAATFRIHSPPT